MEKTGHQFCYLVLCFVIAAFVHSEARSPLKEWSIITQNEPANNMQHQKTHRFRRETTLEMLYSFDDEFQSAVVDTHNNARSSVSPTAANMRQMRWDDGLGKLATDYAAQCVYKHNSDRSQNSEFGYVGENLYISRGISYGKTYVEGAIHAWDNERSDFTYSSNTCKSGKSCGHYTQIAWADTYAVGCGAASCSSVVVNGKIWNDATIVVCNYGPGGNYKGVKPFKEGIPCSQCEKSLSICKKNLCSSSQTVGKTTVKPTTKSTTEHIPPVASNWEEWGSWSDCSVTCGSGRKHQRRRCSTGKLYDCEGFHSRSRTCEAEQCSSIVHWQEWGPWSECNASCGKGIRFRFRSCAFGNQCQGHYGLSQTCYEWNCSQ